jgi:hypothetical protein
VHFQQNSVLFKSTILVKLPGLEICLLRAHLHLTTAELATLINRRRYKPFANTSTAVLFGHNEFINQPA